MGPSLNMTCIMHLTSAALAYRALLVKYWPASYVCGSSPSTLGHLVFLWLIADPGGRESNEALHIVLYVLAAPKSCSQAPGPLPGLSLAL
jgi:hypothetical protein